MQRHTIRALQVKCAAAPVGERQLHQHKARSHKPGKAGRREGTIEHIQHEKSVPLLARPLLARLPSVNFTISEWLSTTSTSFV
jgi:hypothetical protein